MPERGSRILDIGRAFSRSWGARLVEKSAPAFGSFTAARSGQSFLFRLQTRALHLNP